MLVFGRLGKLKFRRALYRDNTPCVQGAQTIIRYGERFFQILKRSRSPFRIVKQVLGLFKAIFLATLSNFKKLRFQAKLLTKRKDMDKKKEKHWDLVGLVTSWVSSNNHSNFLQVSLGQVRLKLIIAMQGQTIGLAGLESPAVARNKRKSTVII